MSEITDTLSGYLNELDNYMERLNSGRLSRNDRKTFLEMSNEYYDIFQKAVSAETFPVPKELLNAIEGFNNDIVDESRGEKTQIRTNHKRIVEYANSYIENTRRNELVSEVFREDAEIIRRQNEKVLKMQELVDLDMKLSGSGELSKNIKSILEVQHMEVTDGRVREVMEWEQQKTEKQLEKSADQMADTKEKTETPETDPTPEQMGIVTKDTYRAYAYMKGTGSDQNPKPIYGDSPAGIIAIFQKWNQARTKAMKLQICYIQKLNADTNKFESAVKYDIESGRDITPIYLNLPHMGKDAFKQLVAQIKADGARYNTAKKAFYITRQDDLNKFAEYLPLPVQNQKPEGDAAKTDQAQSVVQYTVESGREYYDNRVQVTIEGLKPFNVYGDDYDVHFPSMSIEDTKAIIEKFVLPDYKDIRPDQELPTDMEYNGRKYDAAQYAVLRMAEKQKFTREQMTLLERPDLSSDKLEEIRFSVRDGLTPEQIQTFMSKDMELWQMDLCRIGLQHGLHMGEIAPIIDSKGYTPDKWGERRNRMQKLVHAKDREEKRNSLMGKLSENKSKVETAERPTEGRGVEKTGER